MNTSVSIVTPDLELPVVKDRIKQGFGPRCRPALHAFINQLHDPHCPASRDPNSCSILNGAISFKSSVENFFEGIHIGLLIFGYHSPGK